MPGRIQYELSTHVVYSFTDLKSIIINIVNKYRTRIVVCSFTDITSVLIKTVNKFRTRNVLRLVPSVVLYYILYVVSSLTLAMTLHLT